MHPATSTQAHRAAEVAPAPRYLAAWRVTDLEVLTDFRIHVGFVDGTWGEVHMKTFLNQQTVKNTIFEPLRDSAFFAQAKIVSGVVEWPNGADLAPDAMYDAIVEHGSWIVE